MHVSSSLSKPAITIAVFLACLCVLLGGPSFAAAAGSLTIDGDTYDEPGVSGPGWSWADADHLELNGYNGQAIGAEGDITVILTGENRVVKAQMQDADISTCGIEVWGALALTGTGSLHAEGSQCGIYAFDALTVDGCSVTASADGAGIANSYVAGVRGASVTVRNGGHLLATTASGVAGSPSYGVYTPSGSFAVDASWVDATGADAGIACANGSLTASKFVEPAVAAFGSTAVTDVAGAAAPHVVIEPVSAEPPTGETEPRESSPSTDTQPKQEPAADPVPNPAEKPVLKPATAPKTVTKTTITTVTTKSASKPKTSTANSSTTAKLPKTGDASWIVASSIFAILGISLLGLSSALLFKKEV